MELKKLLAAVDVQAGLLAELLTVMEQETAQMSEININGMAASNQAKEVLMGKIGEHTRLFQQALCEVAATCGLAGGATLKEVAQHLAGKGAGELLAKQKQLSDTADKLQQAAELNKGIALQFAATAENTLALITRLINQSSVYGSSGGYLQRQTGAVMINREA